MPFKDERSDRGSIFRLGSPECRTPIGLRPQLPHHGFEISQATARRSTCCWEPAWTRPDTRGRERWRDGAPHGGPRRKPACHAGAGEVLHAHRVELRAGATGRAGAACIALCLETHDPKAAAKGLAPRRARARQGGHDPTSTRRSRSSGGDPSGPRDERHRADRAHPQTHPGNGCQQPDSTGAARGPQARTRTRGPAERTTGAGEIRRNRAERRPARAHDSRRPRTREVSADTPGSADR